MCLIKRKKKYANKVSVVREYGAIYIVNCGLIYNKSIYRRWYHGIIIIRQTFLGMAL